MLIEFQLPQPRDSNVGEAYREVIESLDAVVSRISDWLGPSGTVALESGFTANIGTQMSVIVTIPRIGFRDTLFHAYVPSTGYPVKLDFFGSYQVPPCNDMGHLKAMIIAEMNADAVQGRLLVLHQYAQQVA